MGYRISNFEKCVRKSSINTIEYFPNIYFSIFGIVSHYWK